MTVNLRKRKQGKSNKVALYLDIYKGRIIDANGKVKYQRTYEHLNMFIYNNPKNDIDKEHNKNILQLAKSIKNQRELEIYHGRNDSKPDTDYKNINFYEYFYKIVENHKFGPSNTYSSWRSSIASFKRFAGDYITFAEIDDRFCSRFLEYLCRMKGRNNRSLKNRSINLYFQIFCSVVKHAMKDKIITENPLHNIKMMKVKKSEPIFLTFDELRLLIKTDCKYPIIKRAFIFSCLTGLRWSDVSKLKWSEVREDQGKYSIVYRQQKTQELNYLHLSDQSLVYLGERCKDGDMVFNIGNYHLVSRQLSSWCKLAGINKKITYHSSRHTFAVLQLSLGTPIFTVQKLLGHTNINSTMIYANIIDSEKVEAMNKIGNAL